MNDKPALRVTGLVSNPNGAFVATFVRCDDVTTSRQFYELGLLSCVERMAVTDFARDRLAKINGVLTELEDDYQHALATEHWSRADYIDRTEASLRAEQTVHRALLDEYARYLRQL